MKLLIIYDKTGRIYTVQSGVESVPAGIKAVVAEAPEHFSSISMDMETKTPIFGEAEQTEDTAK